MAITFVKVKVANMAEPKRARRFEFLVDSGAVYTVVPERELSKLGIKPTSFEEFTLANGETFRKAVGNALFEFSGKVRAAPVIFGDRGIYLLGATTLEALGMILDPIRRQLKPLPMLLMRAAMRGTMRERAGDTPPANESIDRARR
jgi:predicted aspartyl protease